MECIQTEKHFVHDLKLKILKLLNVILITAAFALVWHFFIKNKVVSPYFAKGNCLIYFIYFILYDLIGRNYDAFLVSYNRISEMVYSQSLAAFITGFILYIITWL